MKRLLKKLFGRTEKVEKISMTIDGLRPYVKKELLSHPADDPFEKDKAQVKELVSEIRTELDVLEDSELENKNIPPRAINMMEGNRKAYILKTGQFIEEIASLVADEQAAAENPIEPLVLDYNKATLKPYMVLKEFFDTYGLTSRVKKLVDLALSMKKKARISRIGRFRSIKRLLDEADDIEKKKDDIKAQIKSAKNKLNRSEKKKEEHLDQIASLKSSIEFISLRDDKVKLKKEKTALAIVSERISLDMMKISRPLRKFSKITIDSKEVDKLIIDPIKGFLDIDDDKLQSVFSNLEKKIPELVSKDNLRDKSLAVIAELRKDMCSLKKDYSKHEKKIEEISSKIDNNPVMSDIEQHERKITEAEREADESSRIKAGLEAELERTSTDRLYEKISVKLEDLGIELKN